MKKFEEPMVEVIAFATENVLEASSTGNEDPSFMGAACMSL